MSRPRYAPITSHLLVRKGDATPWQMPGGEMATSAPLPERTVSFGRQFADEDRAAAADYHDWKRTQDAEAAHDLRKKAPEKHEPAPRHDAEEHNKRLTLRLSAGEYERLGIIGVKRDMTRQQLLRQAVDHYLAAARHEYRSACGCLAGEPCKGAC